MRMPGNVTLALLLSVSGYAQTAPAPVAFEVADVRPSPPGEKPNMDFLPGGKITLSAIPMRQLIALAWDLREDYVTGGPAWLATERYSVVAKAPHDAPDQDLMRMMQNLLKERFKLAVRLEKKVMPVFALTAGKRGPKFQDSTAPAAEDPSCKLQTPQNRKDGLILRTLVCRNAPIGELVDRLPNVAAAYIDQPVVDLTGLKGRYDFTLEWAPLRAGRGAAARGEAPPEARDPDGVPIFTAVQAQLGLKLEPRKLPMDIVVVERVERVPTEN